MKAHGVTSHKKIQCHSDRVHWLNPGDYGVNSVVGNLHERPSLSSLLLAGAMGSDGTRAEWENTAGLVQQRHGGEKASKRQRTEF